MKTTLSILLLAAYCASVLAIPTEPQARLLEEWSACSDFCIEGCKARFSIEHFANCFHYACGCTVIHKEDKTQQPFNEPVVGMPATSAWSVMALLGVGVALVWLVGMISFNAMKRNQAKRAKVEEQEQDEKIEVLLAGGEQDHYQRLY